MLNATYGDLTIVRIQALRHRLGIADSPKSMHPHRSERTSEFNGRGSLPPCQFMTSAPRLGSSAGEVAGWSSWPSAWPGWVRRRFGEWRRRGLVWSVDVRFGLCWRFVVSGWLARRLFLIGVGMGFEGEAGVLPERVVVLGEAVKQSVSTVALEVQ